MCFNVRFDIPLKGQIHKPEKSISIGFCFAFLLGISGCRLWAAWMVLSGKRPWHCKVVVTPSSAISPHGSTLMTLWPTSSDPSWTRKGARRTGEADCDTEIFWFRWIRHSDNLHKTVFSVRPSAANWLSAIIWENALHFKLEVVIARFTLYILITAWYHMHEHVLGTRSQLCSLEAIQALNKFV